MDQQQAKPAIALVIGGPGYRGTVLYWGIIGVVGIVFLVTTITYWRGTLRVIDENTITGIQIKRVTGCKDGYRRLQNSRGEQRCMEPCAAGLAPQETFSGDFICAPPVGTPGGIIYD